MTIAIKDGVDRLNIHQEDQKRQDILNWLSPVDDLHSQQQFDFLRRRQDGTGLWFLQSNEFQDWLHGEKKTLFCPGIPRAGKTILTSILVDHLEQNFASDQNVAVAYLYCNFGQSREQKLEHLLESILRQLVQQQSSVGTIVEALYDEHKRRGGRPRLEAIRSALLSTTASFFRIFIVIDALDECPSESLHGLLSQVFGLQNSRDASTSFFATSRYIPDIVSIFEKQDAISIDIRASPDDVGRYLENHMSRLPSFVARNPQLQEEIVRDISKAVDGMYVIPCLRLFIFAILLKVQVPSRLLPSPLIDWQEVP